MKHSQAGSMLWNPSWRCPRRLRCPAGVRPRVPQGDTISMQARRHTPMHANALKKTRSWRYQVARERHPRCWQRWLQGPLP
jgi:hypothetical protein